MEEGGTKKWSEQVEDLVENGDIEKAISLLESQLQTLTPVTSTSSPLDNLTLSSTLSDLAQLYSIKGLSDQANLARSRARDLKIALDSNRYFPTPSEASASDETTHNNGRTGQSSAVPAKTFCCSEYPDNGHPEMLSESAKTALPGEELPEMLSESAKTALPGEELPEDDWEALADCAPEELLSSQSLCEVSKPLLKENVVQVQAPKRRGRGTFSYTAQSVDNNQQSDRLVTDNFESKIANNCSERDTTPRTVGYGTRHVVVLSDFPPSTTTIDLEKLLKDFKKSEVVIRWVNDTVALAVFKSPAIALEAYTQIACPFTMRVLDDNDLLLSSISPTDLEPPRERPKTSTRAATRLIAHGMGIKLPTEGFGLRELKKQEQARRDRIVSRQHKRDDAWGDDI